MGSEKNIKFLRKDVAARAEAGDSRAQVELGLMYRDGINGEKDYEQALKWFHRVVEEQDAQETVDMKALAAAQKYLGDMYKEGLGVKQDGAQAAEWYEKAAMRGNPAAPFDLAVMYHEGNDIRQDYIQARKWFEIVAESNPEKRAEAQYYLGNIQDRYADMPNAIKYYRRAAEQGHAGAQNNLGIILSQKGESHWFHKAAEQGIVEAQYNLGLMYYKGEDVAKDCDLAAQWFLKAAEQGDSAAQFSLGLMYYKGEGVPQDYTQAADWFRKAAEEGLEKAQYNLGAMYLNGKGVPKDEAQARHWLDLAAQQGMKEAQTALAEIDTQTPSSNGETKGTEPKEHAAKQARRRKPKDPTKPQQRE